MRCPPKIMYFSQLPSRTNLGPFYYVRALVRIEMLYVWSTHIIFMRNLDSLAPMFIEYR